MLNDFGRAEDATQEIFIKAYKSIKKYDPKYKFSTWLFKIANNHCIDLIRASKREKADSLEALLEKDGDKVELSLISKNKDLSLENRELFTKVISHLPDNYRDVIILKEVYSMSYKEVATILECSTDAVKARLKRARKEINSNIRHFLEVTNV